jgi:hypothetical protein
MRRHKVSLWQSRRTNGTLRRKSLSLCAKRWLWRYAPEEIVAGELDIRSGKILGLAEVLGEDKDGGYGWRI